LWVRPLSSGAIIVGTARHLLRSGPPMIAVRYTYLPRWYDRAMIEADAFSLDDTERPGAAP
jgi:hypothetical protein